MKVKKIMNHKERKVAVSIDKKDKLPFTKKDTYPKTFFKKIPNLILKL